MLEIKIDSAELRALAMVFPKQMQRAAISVLKTESNRLRGTLKDEASRMQTPVAPITQALRKGRSQIGPFLSRFMSYHVDPQQLLATVGIRKSGPQSVNQRLAILAEKQATGFRIPVSRRSQAGIGRKLSRKYRAITERGQWGRFGGKGAFMPRLGIHLSQPRAIVAVVWKREKATSVANVSRNFAIKVKGGRY